MSFLDNITNTEDDFILHGLADKKEIDQLNFDKAIFPTHLVMKHVRYHNIIDNLLKRIDNIKIIGIIRHPCATINSWFRAEKEFDPKWDHLQEWRFAEKKNMKNIEEYYGFEKWKEAALNFIRFKKKYPDNMFLLKYKDLNNDPFNITKDIFSFSNLAMERQTVDFINQSTSEITGTTYSVYRKKYKDDSWKEQLHPRIIEEVYKELQGTKLEEYMNE